MAYIKEKYTGAALATKERIKGVQESYYTNKVYKNKEHNIFWFINNHGYMHVLRPCAVRLDGEVTYYSIKDFLLDKNNTLQDKGNNGNFDSPQALLDELERMANE